MFVVQQLNGKHVGKIKRMGQVKQILSTYNDIRSKKRTARELKNSR